MDVLRRTEKNMYGEFIGGRYDGMIMKPPFACYKIFKIPIYIYNNFKRQSIVGYSFYRFDKAEQRSDGIKRAVYQFSRDEFMKE